MHNFVRILYVLKLFAKFSLKLPFLKFCTNYSADSRELLSQGADAFTS